MTRIHMEVLPSLHRLVKCVKAIAEVHGEDRALEWFGETVEQNFSLFIRVEPAGPHLTIIRGGA